MRRRVSGATPTLNHVLSKAVTVRQVPVFLGLVVSESVVLVGGWDFSMRGE